MAQKQVIDPEDTPYTIVVQSEDRPRPLLIGLLIGVVVGGAVAWFLAPRSGSESRQQVARIAGTAQTSAQEQIYKVRTTVRSVIAPNQ